jgi:hypothetical protein
MGRSIKTLIEAFSQPVRTVQELFIAILLALLAAALAEVFFQPLRRLLRRRKIKREISKISSAPPSEFAALTITWKDTDGEARISSISDIQSHFVSLLKSQNRIAVIVGKFGMGKSYLSRHLSSLRRTEPGILGRRILPIYLDATRFRSPNVTAEIIVQLNNQGLFDFVLSDLTTLCRRAGTAFIIDGLDQMPSADKGGEILSQTLDFVGKVFAERGNKATAILVVRSEFYDTSPKLQDLAEGYHGPLITVEGFTEGWQQESYLLNVDKVHGNMRVRKLHELTNSNDQLRELFERPLLLQRFTKISPDRIRSLVPSGVTLAQVYRMSFGELELATREAGQRIAFELYNHITYVMSLESNFTRFAVPISDRAVTSLKQSGILLVDQGTLSFSHATFRDYFAAEAILRAINEDHGAESLGGRIIHYLVSEFVAGLMDESTLNRLLNTIENSKDKVVRFNGMDILTEIVDDAKHEVAKQYLEKKVSSLDFTSDRLDTEKLFLGSIAGIYGMAEPMKYVLKQLKRLGPTEFMDKFFYTQGLFGYYGGSIDRCLCEWLDHLTTRKHAHFRTISCALIAEMGFRRAIPILSKVVGNPEEDKWVRECAVEALSKLMNTEGT